MPGFFVSTPTKGEPVKIIALERSNRPTSGQYKEVAKFDLQPVEGVLMRDVRLLERADGWRVV